MNYIDIHAAILEWYRRHGRHDLPWRQTRDPYRIYVSEIMLQQTQVKTVLERFYHPFLERFPTLSHLAAAPLQEVLHAWQGLGYYRRARYLHETARLAAPTLPTDPEKLVKLPGIGQSTAHAVAVFATDAALPILDANVRRILHRFFALEKATPKALWQTAWRLLDRQNPYDYNQAMMDIGAAVCLPRSPLCHACPLRSGCRGQKAPERYPAPRPAKKRPTRRTRYLVVEKEGKILMRKREGEMLGGLWELPSQESEPEGTRLFEIVHDYTHFRRIAEVWRVERCDIEGVWIEVAKLNTLPTSSLEKKIFARLLEPDAYGALVGGEPLGVSQ
ncbi:A/G-specific adenine glycosylase [Hydrogenimonas sp.]